MAVAIVCGVLAGLVGFLPLFGALRLSRRSESQQTMTLGLYALGGACVSLIVVAVALVACAMIDRGQVLPFAIAEIVSLILVTSLYVVYKNVLAKRKHG